jgi:hypothetical protein
VRAMHRIRRLEKKPPNKLKQNIKKIIKTPNRTAENQTLLYTYM